MTPDNQDLIKWYFPFDYIETETGEQIHGTVDVIVLWELFNIAQRWGTARAFEMLRLGAFVGKESLNEADEQRIKIIFDDLLNTAAQYFSNQESLREFALQTSYVLLSRGDINRDMAADQASHLLGKEIPSGTWRKAVDKWAVQNGHPPIKLLPGRPSKIRNT